MPAGDALFRPEGGSVFRPTELTRGPWTDDAQHGGPVAALLAGAVEAVDAERGLQVARLTYELLRPVPLEPLRVEAAVQRAGRSVDRVSATAYHAHSGEAVVTLLALRIRRKRVPVPSQPEPLPSPQPDELRPHAGGFPPDRISFVSHAMEMRFTAGSFERPGPAAAWFRLVCPVVAGQPTSPVQRVVAAADSANGISNIADFQSLLYINPDLTVALHRHPAGEWVCLDAVSWLDPNGIGGAEAAILDERGRIGRSYQTLLISQR